MKVKLKVQLSGTRDGVPWPSMGTVVELPDDEARDMLYSGTAGALDDNDNPDPVVMVPADADEAIDKFIPETARHEPAGGIENVPDEDRRPNMAAIGIDDTETDEPGDEPVDMAAEAASGTRTRTKAMPTKRTGPVTTKTGPTKKPE